MADLYKAKFSAGNAGGNETQRSGAFDPSKFFHVDYSGMINMGTKMGNALANYKKQLAEDAEKVKAEELATAKEMAAGNIKVDEWVNMPNQLLEQAIDSFGRSVYDDRANNNSLMRQNKINVKDFAAKDAQYTKALSIVPGTLETLRDTLAEYAEKGGTAVDGLDKGSDMVALAEAVKTGNLSGASMKMNDKNNPVLTATLSDGKVVNIDLAEIKAKVETEDDLIHYKGTVQDAELPTVFKEFIAETEIGKTDLGLVDSAQIIQRAAKDNFSMFDSTLNSYRKAKSLYEDMYKLEGEWENTPEQRQELGTILANQMINDMVPKNKMNTAKNRSMVKRALAESSKTKADTDRQELIANAAAYEPNMSRFSDLVLDNDANGLANMLQGKKFGEQGKFVTGAEVNGKTIRLAIGGEKKNVPKEGPGDTIEMVEMIVPENYYTIDTTDPDSIYDGFAKFFVNEKDNDPIQNILVKDFEKLINEKIKAKENAQPGATNSEVDNTITLDASDLVNGEAAPVAEIPEDDFKAFTQGKKKTRRGRTTRRN